MSVLVEPLQISMVLLNRVNCRAFRGIIIKVVILCQHTIAWELEGDFSPTVFTEDQLNEKQIKQNTEQIEFFCELHYTDLITNETPNGGLKTQMKHLNCT